jgi:hypothetical protein
MENHKFKRRSQNPKKRKNNLICSLILVQIRMIMKRRRFKSYLRKLSKLIIAVLQK